MVRSPSPFLYVIDPAVSYEKSPMPPCIFGPAPADTTTATPASRQGGQARPVLIFSAFGNVFLIIAITTAINPSNAKTKDGYET